jgi:hypothetical protein
MATIIPCGVCKYVITFRDIAPAVISEREHEVTCPRCGAMYAILVRMTQGPEVPAGKVEEIKNRPSA